MPLPLARPVAGRARSAALVALVTAALTAGLVAPAAAGGRGPEKAPEAVGYGGAVASVDADATAAGIKVLRRGGNAVDAAVATAAALGVTEPYSAGIGGGGFLVVYEAATGEVHTVDGRETAPASAGADLFLEDGLPVPFGEAVTSGLSVGVPGTPMTWQVALDRWGTLSLRAALRPAERLARRGFTVDQTFTDQTAANAERFAAFPATAQLFLPGGAPPAPGTRFRNPDLAATYRLLGRDGVDVLYRGELGEEVVATVQDPPVDPASTRVVRPGDLTTADLADYTAPLREPTRTEYRGLEVFGMAPPSSGGTTVGEALNLLEALDARDPDPGDDLAAVDATTALHRYLEASKVAFADRNRWVGDPAFSDVPAQGLLSQEFADSRACPVSDDAVLPVPVAPGDPDDPRPCVAGAGAVVDGERSGSTTHLTTADRWGNVVAYTLTIEQTGGSGITVPGRGFLLNNELTDFSFAQADPAVPDPNLPGPGKRPRSSMAPTIVLEDGEPVLAVGSPGGSTIITTVLQVLVGRLDRDLTLAEAIAAPRASQRNTASVSAEPSFLATPEAAGLAGLGHVFASTPEIGAATGVERLPDGRWVAAAEPTRRGGGSAAVLLPWPRPGHD
ncbi:MAG: gamma-glutamyltransferase [Actinomycetales bacterium]